jgi:hypothetical protein
VKSSLRMLWEAESFRAFLLPHCPENFLSRITTGIL